ncbi:MAG TPA: ornithine cyclodeaminase family protein [Chthoniobacterales bacterium]|nr:ornithine cyclodeaminase family protein [Chthoniobacterales bacterium]
MKFDGTLLLNRSEVATLLSLPECIEAVDEVFRLQGQGKIPAAGILGVKASGGGLHVKAGVLPEEKSYIVAKLNTNFPDNPIRLGRPTIQGLIVVCDGDDGSPLAVMDSIDITIKRTAAASAVAAKYLARTNSSVLTLVGCGQQARAQLEALQAVVPVKTVYVFDTNEVAAENFASKMRSELLVQIEPVRDLSTALGKSDLCVTCTTSREFFVKQKDVPAGMFIAAVGADDANKQEIDPALMASSKIVADSLEQCCMIGDTHHAIVAGLMGRDDVYAELSEVVSGKKAPRTSEEEVIIFDSTGVASEDAATAVLVLKKARARQVGRYFTFAP